MNTGARIAAWRKHRRMSQRELAKAVGVTQGAVAQWEGEGTPSLDNLGKIVDVLGLTMERFFGRLPKREAKAS